MSLTICVKNLENSKQRNEAIEIPVAYQHMFIKSLNIENTNSEIDFVDLDVFITNVQKLLDVYVSNHQPRECELSISKVTFNRIKNTFNDIIVIAKNAQDKNTSVSFIY